jgi:hypothetical protein
MRDEHGNRLCMCGSGLARHALVDAAGIFCGYVCEKCERSKRNEFNPLIFKTGNYFSELGETESDD